MGILDNLEAYIDFDKVSNISHYDYLNIIKDKFNLNPTTVYDIGSNSLQWTTQFQRVYPSSEVVVFEAMVMFENLYKEHNLKYHIGVLSDTNKTVNFYQNEQANTGSSYYLENSQYGAPNGIYLPVTMDTLTLDEVVENKGYPLPELMKIDVQGSELDILMGSSKVLEHCSHLIIELRNVEYNLGSPEKETVIAYLESIGYTNIGMFNDNGPDADYHFYKPNHVFL